MSADERRATVVILAKDTRTAKTRLELPRGETRRVALHLAAATVRSALAAERVGAVLVVTGDPEIALDALEAGADVLAEPRPLGMNRAAQLGLRHAVDNRASCVAIMVADLPHLRPEDLDSVVEEHLATGQSLYVADRLGAGTTFLIHGADRRPGIGFGWNSAAMHDRLGYRPALTATDGLRTDLDSRDDLDRLAGRIFRGPPALAHRTRHAKSSAGPAPHGGDGPVEAKTA